MIATLKEIALAVNGELYGNPDTVVHGISTDSRKIEAEEMFIALRGERFDGHDFIPSLAGKCAAVLSEVKTNDLDCVVVPDTLKALGALAAYWRKKCNPVLTVGVTGSVGKTTTKELIASVLKEKFKTHFTTGNLNNQIGVPITLIRIEEGCEAVVCEMGMNARGEIEYLTDLIRPNLAVITNIGVSHMENLGSREGIMEAKLEILSGMEKGSTVILDGDEPLFRLEKIQKILADYRIIYVGFSAGNDVYPLDIYKGKDSISFDVISKQTEFRVTVPAIGDHFVKNSLFAAAVGLVSGVSREGIQNGLLSYTPSGMRQRIYETKGIRVIADCYNASPESMEASLKVLKGFEGRRIAVLGDMLELGFLTDSAHETVGIKAVNCADVLITYGKNSYHMMKGALKAGMNPEAVSNFVSADSVIKALKQCLQAGDTVLFKASRRMELEDVIASCGLAEEK